MQTNKPLTLRLLGVPHMSTNHETSHCAFSQKAFKKGKMMSSRGLGKHNVVHYGCDTSDLICDAHITVTRQEDLERVYGDRWMYNFFDFDWNDEIYQEFTFNTVNHIREHAQEDDIILPTFGWGHKSVCDQLIDLPVHVVEYGVGYPTTFSRHRVYESAAKMHHDYGKEIELGHQRGDMHNITDAVIPNFFDLDEFAYSDRKSDYILYLGRIIPSKGLEMAMRIADALSLKLVVAGHGTWEETMGFPPWDCVEILGPVGKQSRKKLLSEARFAICYSLYMEPFCGVHIEALLSGTPVLTSDFGVFRETVENGYNGYRFRYFKDGVKHAKDILFGKIRSEDCRASAMKFSLQEVGKQYEQYYDDLIEFEQNMRRDNFWYKAF